MVCALCVFRLLECIQASVQLVPIVIMCRAVIAASQVSALVISSGYVAYGRKRIFYSVLSTAVSVEKD